MAVEVPPLIKPSGIRRRGGLLGECLAECLGMFVLISFGCGVAAMAVAALPGSGRTAGATTSFVAAGDWVMPVMGWGLAVAFAIYVAGGVSGAHLNPAVTLAFAIRRRFPWSKVGPYVVAQVVGAFAGAALVYAVYHDAISALDHQATGPKTNGHTLGTFSIFSTFPAAYFHGGIWGPFLDQVVGTAFMLIFIMAVIDLRNPAVRVFLGPLVIGLGVAAIGLSYGANAGYAINPARDFGPRVFAWAMGWNELALPGSSPGSFSNYFWIPLVAPLVGGVIGVLVYDLLIGDVLHARTLMAKQPEVGCTRPVTSEKKTLSPVASSRSQTSSR
ncbi:aquaporin [Streptomyces sp. Act143]|uniref:MIP/aquaporin family protein n=1 Tax=Streptomyces sp. Act143 TaxID=2200760 RepID=UPI000D682546|nr:MIP/aquaporin family protein [Streptomyces sp. Act143]PWI20906.1 aquaporin [Streptomyces sp. Act143]